MFVKDLGVNDLQDRRFFMVRSREISPSNRGGFKCIVPPCRMPSLLKRAYFQKIYAMPLINATTPKDASIQILKMRDIKSAI